MWCLYTRDNYSILKDNYILSYATMWMKLDDITLREMSFTKRSYCMNDSMGYVI